MLMCVLAPVRIFSLLCFQVVASISVCGAEPVRSGAVQVEPLAETARGKPVGKGRPLGDSTVTSTLPSRGQSEIFFTSKVTLDVTFLSSPSPLAAGQAGVTFLSALPLPSSGSFPSDCGK